jgi:hypothetical protein
MTISVAWVRRNKGTVELLVASDSRLRSRGAIDQAQKIFPLLRGDCFLSFAGDSQISYPLFIQIGSTLNNHLKTRTRAKDVTELTDQLTDIINAYISSWDLPKAQKSDELKDTTLLFGGWSWRNHRFYIRTFRFNGIKAECASTPFRIGHPWHERVRSLAFVGDYENEYRDGLAEILARSVGMPERRGEKQTFDFDYQPVEALNILLKSANARGLTSIGGVPQFIKVYPYGSSLPFVTRIDAKSSYLFGRKLFEWEKSEFPILDLSKPSARTFYPLAHVPLPGDVTKARGS